MNPTGSLRLAALLIGLLVYLLGGPASAAPRHTLHAGVGWQNTGAIRSMTWEPGIQGSRKDVPVVVGWSRIGDHRLYYAPFARVEYLNTWSMGGSMNLLGLDLGLAGLGVYLTPPPDRARPERDGKRWFATLEVNVANIRVGANVTPDRPHNDEVPDPDARRSMVTAYRDADRAQELASIQRYPFGPYRYVAVGVPLQLRVWKMVRPDLGVGGFFEHTLVGFEWPLDRPVTRPAMSYDVLVGLSIVFGPPR